MDRSVLEILRLCLSSTPARGSAPDGSGTPPPSGALYSGGGPWPLLTRQDVLPSRTSCLPVWLTLIFRGLASSATGMVRVSTPSRYSASILSSATP